MAPKKTFKIPSAKEVASKRKIPTKKPRVESSPQRLPVATLASGAGPSPSGANSQVGDSDAMQVEFASLTSVFENPSSIGRVSGLLTSESDKAYLMKIGVQKTLEQTALSGYQAMMSANYAQEHIDALNKQIAAESSHHVESERAMQGRYEELEAKYSKLKISHKNCARVLSEMAASAVAVARGELMKEYVAKEHTGWDLEGEIARYEDLKDIDYGIDSCSD